MLLSELSDNIHSILPSTVNSTLSQVVFDGMNDQFLLPGGERLNVSEDSLGEFLKLVKMPKNFHKEISRKLLTDIIEELKLHHGEQIVTLEHDDQGNFVDAYPASPIGRQEIFSLAERVFDGDTVVNNLRMHRGITLDLTVEELSVEPKVNDFTVGGLRIGYGLTPQGWRPELSSFLNRLVCSNGMVVDEGLKFRLRGSTLTELLVEMEAKANELLSLSIPEHLESWGKLTTVHVDNPEQYVHRSAVHYGLSPRIESAMLDLLPARDGDTVYDVINSMTSIQHAPNLRQSAIDAIQLTGGSLVREGADSRCPRCENVID